MAVTTENSIAEMILDLQNRLVAMGQTDADWRTTAQLSHILYGRLIKHFNMQLDPAAIKLGDNWMYQNLGMLIEQYRDQIRKQAVAGTMTFGVPAKR